MIYCNSKNLLKVTILALGILFFVPNSSGANKAEMPTVQPKQTTGQVTGLPMPRFVSVKSDKMNVRTGPGTRYPIEWVFTRSSMPVQIVAEYEHWRKIRDYEGVEGWVHRTMLSGRRSVMIVDNPFILRRTNSFNAAPIVRVMPTVAGELETCEQGWCRLSVSGFKGWAHHENLWGVTMDEVF